MKCHHCGKKGHKIRDCRFKKVGINFNHGNSGNSGRSKKAKANTVESSSQGLVAMVSIVPCTMVTELNMVVVVAVKSQDWWLDSGATVLL